jgi:hypothetical protein
MRLAAVNFAPAPILLTLLLSSASTASAQAPVRMFDGTWYVVVACTTAEDGALGYNWRFQATIANGVLRGVYGIADTPSSMTLEGTIGPDGNALLFASGLTGKPAYNVRRVEPGRPFKYHAKTHFTATHGEGTRIELRPCTLTFDKG